MRTLDFDFPRPENDRACEREHHTHFRRVFVSLWPPAEAWVEESLRTQEKEETAPDCAVEMWLCPLPLPQQPPLVLLSSDKWLLPKSMRLLDGVYWLWVAEARSLSIVPKLWKEIHIAHFSGRNSIFCYVCVARLHCVCDTLRNRSFFLYHIARWQLGLLAREGRAVTNVLAEARVSKISEGRRPGCQITLV